MVQRYIKIGEEETKKHCPYIPSIGVWGIGKREE